MFTRHASQYRFINAMNTGGGRGREDVGVKPVVVKARLVKI